MAIFNELKTLIEACKTDGIQTNPYWLASYSKPDGEHKINVCLENMLPADDFYTGQITELNWPGWAKPYTERTYAQYEAWVEQQILRGDTLSYSQPRESFSRWEAFNIAQRLGKQFIILEDLS